MDEIWIIIVILLIALVVGFAAYNVMRKSDFTRNAKIIMRQLFIENQKIDEKLDDEKTIDAERTKLTLRKKEITQTLSKFYGYELV